VGMGMDIQLRRKILKETFSRNIQPLPRFLDAGCVFPQGKGESEMDVMVRILSMEPDEVHKRRQAIGRLRARLNDRAIDMFASWVGWAINPQVVAAVQKYSNDVATAT
jgi:hypothetical protein